MDNKQNGFVVKMEKLSDQERKFVNGEMNVVVKSELPEDFQQNSTSSAIKQETEMLPVLEYFNQFHNNNAFEKIEGMFQCKKCGRLYADEDYMVKDNDDNQTLGRPVKEHDCSFCHYSSDDYKHFFTQKGNLVYYRSVIKMEKDPYKCLYCNKLFELASTLRAHIRIHTYEKPYKCKECPAAFSKSAHLSSHVITKHTKHSSYRCHVCDKCFTQACDWKKHIGVHTNEKRYRCKGCSASFTTSRNLSRHISTSHAQRYPHRRHMYGNGYLRLGFLNNHIKEHHGNHEDDPTD